MVVPDRDSTSDAVVAPPERHLRSGERVGLSLPGLLSGRRVRLRDEPRRAAARDRDALAAGRQGCRDVGGQHARAAPAGWLRDDLLLRALARGHVLVHRWGFLAHE